MKQTEEERYSQIDETGRFGPSMVRQVFPELLSNCTVSVQPTSQPTRNSFCTSLFV